MIAALGENDDLSSKIIPIFEPPELLHIKHQEQSKVSVISFEHEFNPFKQSILIHSLNPDKCL